MKPKIFVFASAPVVADASPTPIVVAVLALLDFFALLYPASFNKPTDRKLPEIFRAIEYTDVGE